jgi:hypothetical protein
LFQFLSELTFSPFSKITSALHLAIPQPILANQGRSGQGGECAGTRHVVFEPLVGLPGWNSLCSMESIIAELKVK